MRIEKLAIANRGEVAVRIITAAKELGIKTALLHSEADVSTLAYRLADEKVLIGPSPVGESYLNIERNILAAKSVEADAIHPGFGFLSENADFAKACEENKIIFVGPSVESIKLFGDKISAKELVKKAGAPVIPGYQGEDQSTETLITRIKEIGLPAIVKAAGGGGGRGLRVVHKIEDAKEAIESARREGISSFSSDRLLVEKYFDHAKHIEVQIFGDAKGKVYHLFERDCSVQRRHQKVIEEGPAVNIDPHVRAKMQKAAVVIGETANYRGAGTVEFLYQDGEFYFMEMNTRLQVEHPVTEMILGVDLVKAQIMTAEGRGLLWSQEELKTFGHAIECRIYAEDPYMNGVPSTGKITGMRVQPGPGRRYEFGFEPGDEVSQFYDSMIAKIVVHDETRLRAIKKMCVALRDTVIFGVKTNIPFLIAMLERPEFLDGKMTTQFIQSYFPNGLTGEELNDDDKAISELVKPLISKSQSQSTSQLNPWAARWRG
jgi:3-methylcrotonyl-CoA carboxylase alpha subunit